MFGKRKPRDEDDPLVPHGLVWYATETPPRDELNPGGHPKQSAEVIEINRPRPAQPAQQPDESSKDNAPHSLASPDVQEPEPTVARPTDVSAKLSALDPIVISPPPQPIVEPSQKAAQQLHVAEVIDISSPSPPDPDKEASPAISRSFLWLSASATTALSAVFSVAEKVRRGASRTWNSVHLQQQFLHGKAVAAQLLRNGAGLTHRYHQATKNTLAEVTQTGKRQQQHLFQKLKSIFGVGTKQVSGYLGKSGHKSKRIRIVLTGLPLRLRILFARRFSEWEMMQIGTADARLRSSIMFAAISAILVLIIVSLIPRYAAKSLPSRMFSATPTVSASTAPVSQSVTASKPIPKKTSVATKATKITRSLTPVQKPVLAIKKTPRRKVYRAAEDDYIAPDTYTYYGSKSSVSR